MKKIREQKLNRFWAFRILYSRLSCFSHLAQNDELDSIRMSSHCPISTWIWNSIFVICFSNFDDFFFFFVSFVERCVLIKSSFLRNFEHEQSRFWFFFLHDTTIERLLLIHVSFTVVIGAFFPCFLPRFIVHFRQMNLIIRNFKGTKKCAVSSWFIVIFTMIRNQILSINFAMDKFCKIFDNLAFTPHPRPVCKTIFCVLTRQIGKSLF